MVVLRRGVLDVGVLVEQLTGEPDKFQSHLRWTDDLDLSAPSRQSFGDPERLRGEHLRLDPIIGERVTDLDIVAELLAQQFCDRPTHA